MNRVVVFGAQGCGKTVFAECLRRKFGCERVVDDWDGRAPLKDGDLALTFEAPPYAVAADAVHSFTDAIGLPATTTQAQLRGVVADMRRDLASQAA